MNSSELIQKLSSVIKDQRHPPLYLVNPAEYQSDSEWLMQWLEQLFITCYGSTFSLQNHPDVLLLASSTSQLKSEQVEQVFDFLKSGPMQLGQKWVIVPDAATLTNIHQNKLLKVFEEPPVKTVFFLLNPKRIKLIDTVLSRSQAVRVQSNSQQLQQFEEQLSELKKLPLAQFQEQMRSGTGQLKQLLEYLSTRPLQQGQAAFDLSRIIQDYQQDLTFHNSPQYLLYKVHAWLQKYDS